MFSRPFIAGEETDSPRWRKHDESYINVTKNRKFIGFLDKPISSFWESNLPICCVFNSLYLKLHSPHFLYFLSLTKNSKCNLYWLWQWEKDKSVTIITYMCIYRSSWVYFDTLINGVSFGNKMNEKDELVDVRVITFVIFERRWCKCVKYMYIWHWGKYTWRIEKVIMIL